MKVNQKIISHFDSAVSLYDDAHNLPRALRHNASRVFVLISSWELLVLARKEMSDFVKTKQLDQKIYKSHRLKLEDAPPIRRNIINNGGVIEESYTGADIFQVRQLALFGDDETSREALFIRGWHYDSFEIKLKSKIDMFSAHIKSIESL